MPAPSIEPLPTAPCRSRRGGLRLALFAGLLALLLPFRAADAQESGSMLDLSLSELTRVEVVALNALGTHTHLEGQWMFSYELMRMSMGTSRDGGRAVTTDEILRDFMVAPVGMEMEAHMVGVMWAPSNELTLMAMGSYRCASMDHVTRGGAHFTSRSSGAGDVALEARYTAAGDVLRDRHRVLLSGRITIPTGSTEPTGDTPAGEDQRLPYPMHLGSGTTDLTPRITVLGEGEKSAWLAEAEYTARVGRSPGGYVLGDRGRLAVWGSWMPVRWLAPSLGLSAHTWGGTRGSDPAIAPMSPAADPERSGGVRLEAAPGLDVYVPGGPLRGLRVSGRLIRPLYERLEGPRLGTDWAMRVGVSLTR